MEAQTLSSNWDKVKLQERALCCCGVFPTCMTEWGKEQTQSHFLACVFSNACSMLEAVKQDHLNYLFQVCSSDCIMSVQATVLSLSLCITGYTQRLSKEYLFKRLFQVNQCLYSQLPYIFLKLMCPRQRSRLKILSVSP